MTIARSLVAEVLQERPHDPGDAGRRHVRPGPRRRRRRGPGRRRPHPPRPGPRRTPEAMAVLTGPQQEILRLRFEDESCRSKTSPSAPAAGPAPPKMLKEHRPGQARQHLRSAAAGWPGAITRCPSAGVAGRQPLRPAVTCVRALRPGHPRSTDVNRSTSAARSAGTTKTRASCTRAASFPTPSRGAATAPSTRSVAFLRAPGHRPVPLHSRKDTHPMATPPPPASSRRSPPRRPSPSLLLKHGHTQRTIQARTDVTPTPSTAGHRLGHHRTLLRRRPRLPYRPRRRPCKPCATARGPADARELARQRKTLPAAVRHARFGTSRRSGRWPGEHRDHRGSPACGRGLVAAARERGGVPRQGHREPWPPPHLPGPGPHPRRAARRPSTPCGTCPPAQDYPGKRSWPSPASRTCTPTPTAGAASGRRADAAWHWQLTDVHALTQPVPRRPGAVDPRRHPAPPRRGRAPPHRRRPHPADRSLSHEAKSP